jgi:hypothetical protein
MQLFEKLDGLAGLDFGDEIHGGFLWADRAILT